MKRQGMTVTLNELYKLVEELENEFDDGSPFYATDDNRKFQINIINKTPECSDTWEIEKIKKICPKLMDIDVDYDALNVKEVSE